MTKQTFDVAAVNCKIMGAKLAEPISLETDHGINELVKWRMKGYQRFWLGIDDRKENNK